MSDRLEKSLEKLTNAIAQKDIISLEISGKCDDNGVLSIPIKNKPELKRELTYKISLVSLSVISFFPNLTEQTDKFYYRNATDQSDKVLTLDIGGYNIKDYEDTVHLKMKALKDDPENISIKLMPSGKVAISLANGYKVFFNKHNTWRNILGFEAVDLTTDGLHLSSKIANVLTVQKVYVKCNLACGSIFNGETSNILYSFPNTKRYGAVINMNPNPLIPLKLQTTNIDNVRLQFVDEDGEGVNFLRTNVCCQLLIEQF